MRDRRRPGERQSGAALAKSAAPLFCFVGVAQRVSAPSSPLRKKKTTKTRRALREAARRAASKNFFLGVLCVLVVLCSLLYLGAWRIARKQARTSRRNRVINAMSELIETPLAN
jgi:hypothetical protein